MLRRRLRFDRRGGALQPSEHRPPAPETSSLRLPGYAEWLLDTPSIVIVCLAVALALRVISPVAAITSDEGYWMQRTVRFGAALERGDFPSTYRSGHPGVTVMWVGLLGIDRADLQRFLPVRFTNHVTLESSPGYLDMLAQARFAIAVATGLLATCIVWLSWRLLGAGPGLLGGILMVLDPFALGISRLLHVDALLAPLLIASALSALVFWTRDGHPVYLILSAVTGGLAILTKAPAIFLIGYVGLVALVSAARSPNRRALLAFAVGWGVLLVAVYVTLWPAMWSEPLQRIGQVIDFTAKQGGSPHNWSNFFLGAPTSGDPGPLYYPVALLYRLSPIVLLGVLLLPLALRRRVPARAPVLGLLAFAVLFAGMMTLGAKKFDRYLLPTILVLDLLAGVGLWALLRTIRSRHVALGALAGLLVVQAALMWKAFPFPEAFYNPLLGGAHGAQQAIMVGWGEGLEQTARYLNAQPNADRLTVSTHYHHVLRPLFRGTTVRIVAPVRLDYFVVYVNMVQRPNLIPATVRQVMETTPPDFTAMVGDVEYAWVYRIPSRIETIDVPGSIDEGDEE